MQDHEQCAGFEVSSALSRLLGGTSPAIPPKLNLSKFLCEGERVQGCISYWVGMCPMLTCDSMGLQGERLTSP